MKTKQIQNIVFDFGGVLLDIDYQRTYTLLSAILNTTFDPDDLPKEANKALFEFETGQINVETFIWNLQQLSIKNTPQGYDVIEAWNAMLIGWNPNKFELLRSLKKKYNLYLLSNTNELHLNWVYKDLQDNHKITDFDKLFFNKTYYSHKLGMRKPHQEIFQFVQHDAGINPNETIFIDDLSVNLSGAQSIGWHTYHHDPKDDLIKIFQNKLKLI